MLCYGSLSLFLQVPPSTNRYERKLKYVSCLLFCSLFRNFELQYLEDCFSHFCHSIVLYVYVHCEPFSQFHSVSAGGLCRRCRLPFAVQFHFHFHDRETERERDFHFDFNYLHFQIYQRLGGAETRSFKKSAGALGPNYQTSAHAPQTARRRTGSS
jgi:hypothetical protein